MFIMLHMVYFYFQDLETQLEDLRKQLEMQSAVLADSDSSAVSYVEGLT